MRLIEEEHQLRLFRVAHFRQVLKQLGQQPQQEYRIQLRLIDQLVRRQQVDHAVTVGVGFHQIVDVQHWLAEELVGALLFQRQQPALDGADRRGRDIAVLGLELFGVVADELHHGAQVLHVQQQQRIVIGDLEHQLQHAALHLVQIQQAPQQQRPEIGNRGADRVALFAVNIPRDNGAGLRLPVGDADRRRARLQFLGRHALGADAGQIALHVGQEHRHADARELFGHFLQRHRLAGAGCPGDQPVAVGQRRQNHQILLRFSVFHRFGDNPWFTHFLFL